MVTRFGPHISTCNVLYSARKADKCAGRGLPRLVPEYSVEFWVGREDSACNMLYYPLVKQTKCRGRGLPRLSRSTVLKFCLVVKIQRAMCYIPAVKQTNAGDGVSPYVKI